MINYNSVRPHGESLKTFGGTASGPDALKTILDKTSKVFLKDNKGLKKLKPIEVMDIANIIAEGIVVGGKINASDKNKNFFNSWEAHNG